MISLLAAEATNGCRIRAAPEAPRVSCAGPTASSTVRRHQGSDIALKLCQDGFDRIRILIDRVVADADCPVADNGGRVQPHQRLLRAGIAPGLVNRRGVAGVLILGDY